MSLWMAWHSPSKISCSAWCHPQVCHSSCLCQQLGHQVVLVPVWTSAGPGSHLDVEPLTQLFAHSQFLGPLNSPPVKPISLQFSSKDVGETISKALQKSSFKSDIMPQGTIKNIQNAPGKLLSSFLKSISTLYWKEFHLKSAVTQSFAVMLLKTSFLVPV